MFENLIKWSKKEYSHLPWRINRTLYTTLVSEIMLQQTTVPTVINKFGPFLKKYPTLKKLSKATDEEVCIAWKGLGYYSRARNLKKAAIDIVANHQGKIPTDYLTLKKLTGIGEYTANALLSIGHKKLHLALDANIERVLCRYLGLKLNKGPQLKKELSAHLEKTRFTAKLNGICPRELNEALMDLGRVYCQANKVECSKCHLRTKCKAYKTKDPLAYPVAIKKEKKFYNLELLRVVLIERGKVLVHKRKKGQWLTDQWELPTFILSTDDEKLAQYPRLNKKLKLIGKLEFKSTITKYKIRNRVVKMTLKEFRKEIPLSLKFEFITLDTTGQNFTTATLKVLNHEIF
ncbi:MAG: A/G-specific adenine glycosylase [Deltaproteobacteria bacterium]|nr:MAG: A/G-specific adenine glycosylase [Deltaproteobacteria bacterium]